MNHAVFDIWEIPVLLQAQPTWKCIQESTREVNALQWRHNGRDSVSNHQPHDCLLSRLFRRRSEKTSKLRVTGLCAGNSPAQMACNAENVSIWWRHHVKWFISIKGDKTLISYFTRTWCSSLSMYKELSPCLNLHHSNIAVSIMGKRSICPLYSYFHIIIVQFSVKSFKVKLDLQNC